ncbi:DUF7344 domain-containing protein [Halorarius litoreus]|uniref:DUF7344 domain-containing protein n=1 Tax=Halorarius litoreus TaxID=2962676 RepID=UPI0020CCC142|nr:hypothetical protein [Halorarius litoreus]
MGHPEQRSLIRRLFEASDGAMEGLLCAVSPGRRRRLLRVLADERHTLTAATRALLTERGEPMTADSVAFQQLYLELYHTDLPALRAAGLVRYDETTGELGLTDDGRYVVSLLPERG